MLSATLKCGTGASSPSDHIDVALQSGGWIGFSRWKRFRAGDEGRVVAAPRPEGLGNTQKEQGAACRFAACNAVLSAQDFAILFHTMENIESVSNAGVTLRCNLTWCFPESPDFLIG
ncbi:hypothetical protein QTI66_07990 [Variovorax sp. J22R133]|uniref:hypothetical protein n=1 Tax=Variovorax brevis TaxID=3053503 RepID=UPI002577C15B|nr:hypothetical protein [Variovorax sp. J22R133]MDM0112086.1 hypothetical protein [Variovorax sp. J22R133]